MAERNPSDTQAAFGVFPQLKRNRSKQDREAAKNVPIDLARGAVAGVLGAPGDIESLVRMLPYLDEKTILPTSEDIEKKLPFRSDTPVSRAATGLGTLGGGFYYGPGSPLKVVGALPRAIKHGAEEFAKASVAGVPHVVKPKGGNWLSGQDRLTVPENDLRRLKTQTIAGETPAQRIPKHEELLKDPTLNQDQIDRVLYQLEQTKGEAAIDNWIESNLKNYVKKEMATPNDPVRKLAEEGIIHTRLDENLDRAGYLEDIRKAEGFPAEGMGKSELARRWENLADDAIRVTRAGAIQDQANTGAKLEQARAELAAYKKQVDDDFIALLKDKGGLSEKDREVFDKMPSVQKAEILGDTKYKELQGNINTLLGRESGFEKAAGELNPFVAKLDPETRLYSGSTYNLGFDHIIDVLRQDVEAGRIRPEQLNKVSMEQAVRRTHEFDQEMAKRMQEAAIKQTQGFPTYKEYPEGYRWIELAPKKEKTAYTSENLPQGFTLEKDKEGFYQVINKNEGQVPTTNSFSKSPEESLAKFNEWAKSKDFDLESALKYEGDTMGHCVGGYCPDVLAGNTRIFSLRDAKGEPHVTVETRPSEITPFDLPKDIYDEYRRHAAIGIPAHGGRPGATEWVKHFYPDVAEKIIPPDRIIQIKGKQNAKPKEDYIPFVQDFVRGGKWSDVGDFKNTGLIREGGQLMTPAEHSDWLLKQLDVPPPAPEGMKRGGKVSISNNPDTMMLELNNQKMAGGGIAKLLRAAPKSKAEIEAIAERIAPQMLGEFVRGEKGTQSVAGKTQKQFAKEKEMKHDIRPTKGESKIPKPVSIEELKDQVMIGIPGDPTISNKTVYSINGMPLDSPSPQHGGPLYGLEHEGDAFWASGLGAANRVQGIAREASQQYDMPVLGKYVMMGPDSINYAQHFADANLAAINLDKMNKAQVEAFNKLVREGYPYKKKGEDFTRQRVFPAFPGIENPSEAYLHFSIDPELRKHFNALMQMPTVTEKYNLPSGIDVRHAVTEPDLRDLEIGVTGKSIGRMRPEVTKLGLSEHPTYSHDIPGEFMGSSKYPIPYELSFPDTVKSVRENPKQAPQEFGSFKMVGPRQVIDQQLIDEIKQYEETIKKLTGKKKGGTVHKAAGGAISGDDLIIEERPL